MLKSSSCPQERGTLHNACQFYRLSVDNSFALNFIYQLHQPLVTLVVLQVVTVEQYFHFVLEILLQIRTEIF